jgi:hypothetical protein
MSMMAALTANMDFSITIAAGRSCVLRLAPSL